MTQPENKPQQPHQWDIDVLSDDYENNPKVMEMERFVINTFHKWVGDAGLHSSRIGDVLNAAPGNPKGLLKGTERSRVIRSANIALRDFDAAHPQT